MKCTRCLKVEIPSENLITKHMMCNKCFNNIEKKSTHNADIQRIRVNAKRIGQKMSDKRKRVEDKLKKMTGY